MELCYLSSAVVEVADVEQGHVRTPLTASPTIDDYLLDENVVFYSAYICKNKVEYHGNETCLAAGSKLFITMCVLCPCIWFGATVGINLLEEFWWDFKFPGVLWAVYLISTVSTVVDYGINLAIISRIGPTKIILNNALGDFSAIVVLLAVCLALLMIKQASAPEDDHNITSLQIWTDIVDSCAILALTASNMVLNNLVGTVIRQTTYYRDLYNEITGPSTAKETAPGTNVETPPATASGNPSTTASHAARIKDDLRRLLGDEVIPAPRTLAANGIRARDVQYVMFLFGRLTNEIGSASVGKGSFRYWLRLKMMLNIASVTLFSFYANIYIRATDRYYIFVLFISILSFLNNLTSAACIKEHDRAVSQTFNNELLSLTLSIGDYTGFPNMQFYYTVFLSLLNVIIRATVAA
jgi:hypothetical protein